MVTELTETEARVVWSHVHNMACPRAGYPEWVSALKKLCSVGGGYACRDCTDLGTSPSKYGGFCCAKHKAQEDAHFSVESKFREAVTK